MQKKSLSAVTIEECERVAKRLGIAVEDIKYWLKIKTKKEVEKH